MEKEGKVIVDRDQVKPAGGGVAAPAGQAGMLERIVSLLQTGGAEPPTTKELAQLSGCAEKELADHLNLLIREGKTVKVKSDLYYAAEPLASVQEKLVAFLKEHGAITPAEFREMTGLSRKFMIPLLEYFDQQKLTIRIGDQRRLRKG
jgi:selenocysteine-specific elongation factor